MTTAATKETKPIAKSTDSQASRGAGQPPNRMPHLAPPESLVTLQRKVQGKGQTATPPDKTSGNTNTTGLPSALQSGVEQLSGMSLDGVRVHYNSDKPAQLKAHAYAQGTEIHVGPGQESSLPHEAWHAVQQMQGRVTPNVQFKGKVPGNDDAGLEAEADAMGAKALDLGRRQWAPGANLSTGYTTTPIVQRNEKDEDEDAQLEQQQEEQQVDVSAVTQEQRDAIQLLPDALLKVDAAELVSAMKEWDESTQLWILKLRSADTTFMKLMLDTDSGEILANKIISKPLIPIPNYLSLINYGSACQIIPTKVGEILSFLVVTLPHAVISGVLNLIPWLAGKIKKSNVFFANAIAARYDVEIDASEWSSAEMRNLWNSFKMVPRKHVQGPVLGVERLKGIGSDFGGRSRIRMATMVPQSLTMGGAENAMRFFTKFLMKRSVYSQRMRNKNAFSMTTLHEVGHAVDTKLGLMASYGDRSDFGGWVKTTPNEIFMKWWSGASKIGDVVYSQKTEELEAASNAVYEDTKAVIALDSSEPKNRNKKTIATNTRQAAYTKWRKSQVADVNAHWEDRIGIPKTIFENLGDYVLAGTVKAKVNAYVPLKSTMTKAEVVAAKAKRSGIIAKINMLPPTRMVKHGKLTTVNMGWNVDRATGRSLSEEFDGKMFHEAYTGQWVGYDINAKKDGVSHYQFRAPGEFFAELYAHYYMDTLGAKGKAKQHPLYDFIDQAVGKNPECSPQEMVKAGAATLDQGDLVEQGVQVPAFRGAVLLDQADEQPKLAPSPTPMDEQLKNLSIV